MRFIGRAGNGINAWFEEHVLNMIQDKRPGGRAPAADENVVAWVMGESVKRWVWMELLNNDQKIRAIIEGE